MKKRVSLLDLLRGVAIVYMMVYHLCFDLKYMFGVGLPDWLPPAVAATFVPNMVVWWILFGVSGICSGYSSNLLRRGAVLYLVGWLLTAGTAVVSPQMPIVFGVLSCFGACMVLTALCSKVLDKIPWWILVSVAAVLWYMFRHIHVDRTIDLFVSEYTIPHLNTGLLYPIGLPAANFVSMDYFPVLPYLFIFWAGRGLYRPVSKGNLPQWIYRSHCRPLEWIGSHSLLVYALHQPVFIGVLMLIFSLLK